MLQADYSKATLQFISPAGTSRGVMQTKETWYIRLYDSENPAIYGVGECALFRGLSAEDTPHYEEQLATLCQAINENKKYDISQNSSLIFGLETALADLQQGGVRTPFPSAFTHGKQAIEINGLVWMGSHAEMQQRVADKLAVGFRCIKLKIGAIDFEAEVSLLDSIRQSFTPEQIEIRLDANGAFSPLEAMQRLERLAAYHIHSIEQPIKQGNWLEMERLCKESPIPIALDEEIIGVSTLEEKQQLLDEIRPPYVIFKPSLCGGFRHTREWIDACEERGIGWWITSALESNIGLNAIAQWCAQLQPSMPQGLGTGQLYSNNVASPLVQQGSKLYYNPQQTWELSNCNFANI